MLLCYAFLSNPNRMLFHARFDKPVLLKCNTTQHKLWCNGLVVERLLLEPEIRVPSLLRSKLVPCQVLSNFDIKTGAVYCNLDSTCCIKTCKRYSIVGFLADSHILQHIGCLHFCSGYVPSSLTLVYLHVCCVFSPGNSGQI